MGLLFECFLVEFITLFVCLAEQVLELGVLGLQVVYRHKVAFLDCLNLFRVVRLQLAPQDINLLLPLLPDEHYLCSQLFLLLSKSHDFVIIL